MLVKVEVWPEIATPRPPGHCGLTPGCLTTRDAWLGLGFLGASLRTQTQTQTQTNKQTHTHTNDYMMLYQMMTFDILRLIIFMPMSNIIIAFKPESISKIHVFQRNDILGKCKGLQDYKIWHWCSYQRGISVSQSRLSSQSRAVNHILPLTIYINQPVKENDNWQLVY